MPVMDEFREEREAIKNSSMKKKWGYFLDYYKWYVIGGAAIILFLVFLIRDFPDFQVVEWHDTRADCLPQILPLIPSLVAFSCRFSF